jgi:hypothetical protein
MQARPRLFKKSGRAELCKNPVGPAHKSKQPGAKAGLL